MLTVCQYIEEKELIGKIKTSMKGNTVKDYSKMAKQWRQIINKKKLKRDAEAEQNMSGHGGTKIKLNPNVTNIISKPIRREYKMDPYAKIGLDRMRTQQTLNALQG